MEQKLAGSPNFRAQYLANMGAKLDEIVRVYKEEVKVFREQNAYLQKKLDQIEKEL